MLARSGVVEENGRGLYRSGWRRGCVAGSPFPVIPSGFDQQMITRYSHGLTEIGLFRRSAAALIDVLRGEQDPLTLLFSSGEPTAADLYLKAPVARAANGLLADTVRALLANLPDDRRLRVLEVGAGTGSATASVLPELPEGRFDYVIYRYICRFLCRGGGAIRQPGYRIPPTGHRKRTLSPRASPPTGTT